MRKQIESDASGQTKRNGLKTAALFAGIGGIERGLHEAGHKVEFLCEIDPDASAVLKARFPDCDFAEDVTKLKSLPAVDLVTAGFPCQDLSQAGGKSGINGQKSGLVNHVFRLLAHYSKKSSPKWLLIENVPYMLSLDRGQAMSHLTASLEELGYMWAYRVVDVRSFGIPQRRPRILLLASKTEDPREVLFADDDGELPVEDVLYRVNPNLMYGFYWTEGMRGVGWAESSVPPIKGGSGIGIPSPPAVWNPQTGEVGTIDVEDAERLQGFPVGWTQVNGTKLSKKSARWRLLGNAVCPEVSKWLGERLSNPGAPTVSWKEVDRKGKWSKAAWGKAGKVFEVNASLYPVKTSYNHLASFLKAPLNPLSVRATSGYFSRLQKCPYRVSPWFMNDIEKHLGKMRQLEQKNALNPCI